MKNVPEKIYLTLGEGANEVEDFKDFEEVSWCNHKVEESDIEYILSTQNNQDLHSASVGYAISQGLIDDTKRQPLQDAFKAGYNLALTQYTAKDKEKDEWISVKDDLPPSLTVVLGFNKKWIDEDFEPEGIRECFLHDDPDITGWSSAFWNNTQDCWSTEDESIPTHWMKRPVPPIL